MLNVSMDFSCLHLTIFGPDCFHFVIKQKMFLITVQWKIIIIMIKDVHCTETSLMIGVGLVVLRLGVAVKNYFPL